MKRNFMASICLWKHINNSTGNAAYPNRCRIDALPIQRQRIFLNFGHPFGPKKQNILILVQDKPYFGAEIFIRGIVGNRLVVG
ncbi:MULTISPECIES: hypothetical protein [Acidithiobacillus]|uniref:hypothetical protein n=1 Tax=Acidithiobacillus TaxID=119977 RepID=UPI00111E1B5A|nr:MULTISPECIES: hypothetical protein [Acidithiobacillus]MBU2740665.1 hypothetical protein [Acidithiobacillus albertensis]